MARGYLNTNMMHAVHGKSAAHLNTGRSSESSLGHMQAVTGHCHSSMSSAHLAGMPFTIMQAFPWLYLLANVLPLFLQLHHQLPLPWKICVCVHRHVRYMDVHVSMHVYTSTSRQHKYRTSPLHPLPLSWTSRHRLHPVQTTFADPTIPAHDFCLDKISLASRRIPSILFRHQLRGHALGLG